MNTEKETMMSNENGQEAEENLSVEALFSRLEQIIDRMQEDCTLEESFALYEKGIADIRRCKEKLDLVEKQMEIINAGGQEDGF